MTNSLKEIINIIKEKPALYLGGHSINLLNAFLNGWISRQPDTVIDINLLSQFQLWIQEKYEQKNTHSNWVGIILFFSVDEYSALNSFFKLFDEFLTKSYSTTQSPNEEIATPHSE